MRKYENKQHFRWQVTPHRPRLLIEAQAHAALALNSSLELFRQLLSWFKLKFEITKNHFVTLKANKLELPYT